MILPVFPELSHRPCRRIFQNTEPGSLESSVGRLHRIEEDAMVEITGTADIGSAHAGKKIRPSRDAIKHRGIDSTEGSEAMSYVRFSAIAVALALAGCSSEALTQAPPYQPPPVGYSTYPAGSIFFARPLSREATAPAAAPGVANSGGSAGAPAPAEQARKR
jgi:hypothetical protein